MSKSLRSMSEFERRIAITRRLSSKTGGLGYWAAIDAQAHLAKRSTNGFSGPALYPGPKKKIA